jgi:hypothetical protein
MKSVCGSLIDTRFPSRRQALPLGDFDFIRKVRVVLAPVPFKDDKHNYLKSIKNKLAANCKLQYGTFVARSSFK